MQGSLEASKRLGGGSNAEVRRVRVRAGGRWRTFAAKRSTGAAQQKGEISQLHMEAGLLSALQHPNVIRPQGWLECEEGHDALLLEMAEGDLFSLIKPKPQAHRWSTLLR